MLTLLIRLACILILSAPGFAAGVWQYCGSNGNTTSMQLSKSGADIVFALTSIPGGTTSLDILMSPDPREIGRFHKVVRDATITPPADSITYTPAAHYTTTLFFYIVDDSANYKQARRDATGACE